MSKRIAITGSPGCGKTTLCSRVAKDFAGEVGGIITKEIRSGGTRAGFRLEDLSTGKRGLLSHVKKCSGPSVGKYSVCLDQLNSIASRAIEEGLKEKDLLIVDEIGPMELKSETFIQGVKRVLDAEIDCLFTVHRRSSHPLLRRIKENFELIKLTKENRDTVFEKVSSTLNARVSDS